MAATTPNYSLRRTAAPANAKKGAVQAAPRNEKSAPREKSALRDAATILKAGDFIRDKELTEPKRAQLFQHPFEQDSWIFAWCESVGCTWKPLHHGNHGFGVGFQSYRKACAGCMN